MNYKKKIIKHYNKLLDSEGFTKAGIGWKSDKLNKRYSIFNNHINFEKKNILDYGAGLANFYDFLVSNQTNFKNYYYYDLNPNLSNHVSQNKKNIKIINSVNKKFYDVTIVNGVYNFNFKNNSKIIIKDIAKLFKQTKYCLGVSILNNNVDYREKHLFYHDENKVFNQFKTLTNSIILDKTFGRYETFFILFRKI